MERLVMTVCDVCAYNNSQYCELCADTDRLNLINEHHGDCRHCANQGNDLDDGPCHHCVFISFAGSDLWEPITDEDGEFIPDYENKYKVHYKG